MGDAPILEFDPDRTAFIDPGPRAGSGRVDGEVPGRAVACFFSEVLTDVCADAKVITTLKAEHGVHHVWELERGGRRFAAFHPGVGAPLAAGFLEEVIAIGCRAIVACGGAGSIVPDLTMGHVVVPTDAIRDEGTSYHYLAAARRVAASPEAVAAIESTLQRHGVPYVTGTT